MLQQWERILPTSKDGKTIMNSNGEFGSENTVSFVLGEEDV
jgi:hypothetical protein